QTPLLTAGQVGSPQLSGPQLQPAPPGHLITAIYPSPASASLATTTPSLVYTASPSVTSTAPPAAILPKTPSGIVQQQQASVPASTVTAPPGAQHGVGVVTPVSSQGPGTPVQGSLPFSLRPARPLQKQQGGPAGGATGAKAKGPGASLAPSSLHEPAGSTRGAGKPLEGPPETAQRPGPEEEACTHEPLEDKASRPPTTDEEGQEVPASLQPCQQRDSGVPLSTGTPAEDRAPRESSPQAGDPGKFTASTEWRGPPTDSRSEAPSSSQAPAGCGELAKPSGSSSSDSTDRKEQPKKLKVRPPPLKKTFDSVDK
ncbi:protein capicua homolog, partial [Rhincodon typus]|uniref:protein capicua homolog n=1 Tax=Rhincodon typus TaxID=259920 RepID=UPI0020309F8A